MQFVTNCLTFNFNLHIIAVIFIIECNPMATCLLCRRRSLLVPVEVQIVASKVRTSSGELVEIKNVLSGNVLGKELCQTCICKLQYKSVFPATDCSDFGTSVQPVAGKAQPIVYIACRKCEYSVAPGTACKNCDTMN
jgi:hypothetical protein